jgi:hypothetical protein
MAAMFMEDVQVPGPEKDVKFLQTMDPNLKKTYLALKKIVGIKNLPSPKDIALAREYCPLALAVSGVDGHLDVLFLAAEPKDKSINVYQELAKVNRILYNADHCMGELAPAAEAGRFMDTFGASFNKRGPHILQFGGHATSDGKLQFNDKLVPADKFVEWVVWAANPKSFHLHGIVLNACNTDVIKEKISPHLGFVVSTDSPVYGEAATRFSEAFFQDLTEGHDLLSAFYRGVIKVGESPNCGHCKNPENDQHSVLRKRDCGHQECKSQKAACDFCKQQATQQAGIYQLSIQRKTLEAIIANPLKSESIPQVPAPSIPQLKWGPGDSW